MGRKAFLPGAAHLDSKECQPEEEAVEQPVVAGAGSKSRVDVPGRSVQQRKGAALTTACLAYAFYVEGGTHRVGSVQWPAMKQPGQHSCPAAGPGMPRNSLSSVSA